MSKSKIIIATLLLSNALAGAMWWRSHNRVGLRQEVHSPSKSAQTMANFALRPDCMKGIDAKDLTYFSATAQQISIVYHCGDGLRFYRWPLTEMPRPSDSLPFGQPQQELRSLMVSGSIGDRMAEEVRSPR